MLKYRQLFDLRFRPLLFLLVLPLCSLAQFNRDEIKVILEEKAGPIHFFDGDGDGDLDILQIAQSANGNLVFYENTGTPNAYNAPIHSGDTIWWNYPEVRSTKCLITDMNEDGLPDAVMHNRVFDAQPYFRNEGNGHFSHPSPIDPEQNTRYHFDLGYTTPGGQPDVIVYQWSPGNLYINDNQGAGVFALQEITGFQPAANDDYHYRTFRAMDIDRDGQDDLVFFFYEKNDTIDQLILLPYHNDGQVFTPMPAVSVDSTASSSWFSIRNIEIADVNQDGYPDLAINLDGCFYVADNDCSDDMVVVLKNEAGTGGFTEIGRVRHVSSSLVADADLDGQMEVLMIQRTFPASPFCIAALIAGDSIEQIVVIDTLLSGDLSHVVDLTQDGYPEIILNNFGFLQNNATGELDFSPLTLLHPYSNSYYNLSFFGNERLLDWDEDGDLDLLVIGVTDDGNITIFLLRNENGLGQYSPPEALWSPTYPFLLPAFASGPISDDGHLDFLIIKRPSDPDTVNVYRGLLGISDPASGAYSTILINDFYLSLPFLLSDDIDNDGDQDILLAQSDGNIAIGWNELSTNNGFDFEQNFINAPSSASNYVGLFLEDIDQDGHKDLVAHTNLGSFFWAHQLGNSGTFEEWQSFPGDPYIYGSLGTLFLRDFDGDGDLDALFSNFALSLYDSESNTFQGLRSLHALDQSWPATPADINMDGTTDLLTKKGVSLSSPGTGYFTTPYLPINTANGYFPDPIFYAFPQVGDIDGDGALEVIFGTQSIYYYNLDFLPASSVQGYIRQDTSLSCAYDSQALPVAHWLVAIENDTLPQVALTNDDGYYGALLPDTLSYRIRPIVPSAYWEVCPTDSLLQAPLPTGVNTVNFVAEAVVDCAILDVDINASHIRQCFNSTISLHYTNIGTQALPDAQIILLFDEHLTPVSSSLPWDAATDTTLTFSLDDVDIGEQGDIFIEFMPDCQALSLGEEICFTTTVTPDSLCQDPYLEWDGANLEANAFCENDSLAFVITNTGQGDMQAPQAIQVDIINDDIVIFLIDDTQLDAGESDTIRVAATPEVMRLHADQPAGHPLPEPINLLAQSCIVGAVGGLALDFPSEQGNPFVNIHCAEVVGPFDPNRKAGLPEGLGAGHLIEKDWVIDYTIQFQNVGTDHALNVSIRDTLSPLLDVSTFKFNGASHAVDVELLPNRELHFYFPNINLPDSISNEPDSHGFVSFSVQPAIDAPPLSVIENRAGIYFDFNEPVMTEYVLHTIAKPQVTSVVRKDICWGENYQGVRILQDTLLEERIEFPEKDSIIWHYITARPIYATGTSIVLEVPAIYNGEVIYGDTSLTYLLSTVYGCDSLLTVHIDAITATDDLAADQWLTAYPNPTGDEILVSWDKRHFHVERIELITPSGRPLLNAITGSEMGTNAKLKIGAYPSGLYFLVVHTREGAVRLKITKR